MTYSSKNLNRDKLVDTIRDFCKLRFNRNEVSEYKKLGAYRNRVEIIADGISFFIDFHFRANGTTTIDTSSGQESLQVTRDEIAQFILDSPQCVIGGESDVSSKCIIVENIDIEDFNTVVELMKESDYLKGITNIRKDGVMENYNVKGSMNENLSIFYYFSNSKVMLHGRPLLLFYEILSYISELIDLEKLPNVFRDYYKIDIPKNAIEDQFQIYFPRSYNIHTGKFRKVLCQCVYNMNLDGDMFDYTFLVFPALRALEGHLKNILNLYDIEYDRNFTMFRKDDTGKRFCLCENYCGKIGNNDKIAYLGRIYTVFNAKRHRLFHWGESTVLGDDTAIIENLDQAKQIIVDTVELIDEFYGL